MTQADIHRATRRRLLTAGACFPFIGLSATAFARKSFDDEKDSSTTSYLRAQSPVAESHYLDYSRDPTQPVSRPRCLRIGASVDRLDEQIDYAVVIEPAANVTEINRAIERAHALGGGVVRPRRADGMIVGERAVRVLDRVVYDGSNIGVHDIRGGKFSAAIEAFEQQDLAIINVRTDGNGGGCYGVRLEDTKNVLIHGVETRNHDQNSIATGLRSVDVTVRFCNLAPGRDDAGNGTFRDQHGIVSSSFSGPQAPAPRGRFGLVYSVGHAWYSNRIEHCDGMSMNAHCSSMECMGNWTDDSRYGAKFPHSANVLIHHNRFGGARAVDPRELQPVVLRFYSANDYAVGVGYNSDKLFLFGNRFEANHGQAIRFDGVHGTTYMIGNSYTSEDDTVIKILPSNATSTDPDSFRGRVLYCLEDGVRTPQISSSLERDRVWQPVGDPRLCSADCDAIIALMNAPPNRDWEAYRTHPLPRAVKFD